MKIFIAQPMSNKSYEQIKFERMQLVRKLENDGHEVLETVFNDFEPEKPPIFYMAKSIDLLVEADRVIFMNGWENAKGCKIEMQIAKDYGKEILILKEERKVC